MTLVPGVPQRVNRFAPRLGLVRPHQADANDGLARAAVRGAVRGGEESQLLCVASTWAYKTHYAKEGLSPRKPGADRVTEVKRVCR